jgi:hypothetical protein
MPQITLKDRILRIGYIHQAEELEILSQQVSMEVIKIKDLEWTELDVNLPYKAQSWLTVEVILVEIHPCIIHQDLELLVAQMEWGEVITVIIAMVVPRDFMEEAVLILTRNHQQSFQKRLLIPFSNLSNKTQGSQLLRLHMDLSSRHLLLLKRETVLSLVKEHKLQHLQQKYWISIKLQPEQ